MPEVPNAYKCDFCGTLMEPIEKNDGRWHTKWCSACGAKLWDVFIEPEIERVGGIPVVRDRGWRFDPHDNDYGPDAD